MEYPDYFWVHNQNPKKTKKEKGDEEENKEEKSLKKFAR